MSLRIFTALMSVVVILAACEEELTLAPKKSGSVNDFPNSIGLQFEYAVLDNLQPPIDSNKPFLIIDTIDQVISGVAQNPLIGTATVWSQQKNNRPFEEKLSIIKGDTVYFVWKFSLDSGYVDKIGLVFPFEYGDTWVTGGILSGDRTTVIDTTSISTPVGFFKDVFVLRNIRRTFTDDQRTITLWFVPGFGIIKIHILEVHAESVGDTTWTLLQHNNPNY